MRYPVDFAGHFGLLAAQSNQQNAEIRPAQIESEEISAFGSVRHGSDERRQHADGAPAGGWVRGRQTFGHLVQKKTHHFLQHCIVVRLLQWTADFLDLKSKKNKYGVNLISIFLILL